MKNFIVLTSFLVGLGHVSFAGVPPTPDKVVIKVTEKGFEPSRATVTAKKGVELTITRTTDATCAKEVLVPSFKIKRPLPLNEPVRIKLTKLEKGELKFTCGMNMMSAIIDAQ